MCELLGMSANVPTDICFSLKGLVSRGGESGPHRDGWGMVLYEAGGMRCFHDPLPSINSEIANLMLNYPIKSHVVISHIRLANRGAVNLKNTHPFIRELWGSQWSMAHNGQLKGIKKWPLGRFKPIGTTDSEHAFCWLLGQLEQRFNKVPKQDKKLAQTLNSLISELHTLGVCNVLLSNGKCLFAFCSTKLAWITRRAPFGEALLSNAAVAVDFSTVTTEKDIVTVIATSPLTDNEQWHVLKSGDFVVFKDGELI